MDGPVAGIAYAAFALTALITGPQFSSLVRRPWQQKKNATTTSKKDELFEDEDGKATAESMANFTARGQFTVAFVAGVVGLLLAFGLAVVASMRREVGYSGLLVLQSWLLVAAWTFTCLQTLHAALEGDCLVRYQLLIWDETSLLCALILASTVYFGQWPAEPHRTLVLGVVSAQVVALIAVALALSFIERRPNVYTPDGTLVERQFQASLWTRYMLSWDVSTINLAATKLIDAKDLPTPSNDFRADVVKDRFRGIALKSSMKMWALLLWAFWWPLFYQYTLIAASTVFDVAPEFAMLHLLRYLENRKEFSATDAEAWIWVVAMFVSVVGSTMVDYRVMWLQICDLGIPMRAILSALVFDKTMKLKNIKEPPKAEQDEKDAGETDSKNKPAEKKARGPQSQQDVVNMYAVDTNMVAMFGMQNVFYLNFFCRLILCIAFLWYLVGWESMFAGMASMVIVYPFNHVLGKRYARLQKKLMSVRDEKTTVITEALNGIRQIKFSAVEPQWLEKIDKVREDELSTIWETRVNNLVMGIASDITPVLFAVFSLVTYTYIHGELLPSVAFTAMSLFISLEYLTNSLPQLLSSAINAKVSADRIDEFLARQEKEENTYPGESICFKKASVSFPSEAEKTDEDRFILRELDIEFPSGELSVISGPTGSGKSLLLAAILGESEVLSGYITVPRAPSLPERFDDKATADNWIIPNAIAFVNQTPWIENATIKDNILFGLPFDKKRYAEVIAACALTKDLAMFEDGDLTEVGAQGISLSGGQKWRLTLARAFYSRAGILILDDVFSALDAHVGKEIYDKALTGKLSKGRTRVLVSHHVSLVMPRAKYAVRLGASGTLEHAGTTNELRRRGTMDEILDAEALIAPHSESGVAEITSEVAPPEQDPSSAADGLPDANPPAVKLPPKKLVEEEFREVGAVKSTVYGKYFFATGGFFAWFIIFSVFIIWEGTSLGRNWWLKVWTGSNEHSRDRASHASAFYPQRIQLPVSGVYQPSYLSSSSNSSSSEGGGVSGTSSNVVFYLGIYVAISIAQVFLSAARFMSVYVASLRASRKIFKDMTHRVLHTPLRWLDTVPSGRILNRFTADFQNLDSALAMNFAYVADAVLRVIGTLVAAFFISPWLIAVSLALLVVCIQFARRYLAGARSIKRLESIQKSPMISHFGSTLDGLSTIRAFDKGSVFVQRAYVLINNFSMATWCNWLASAWVGLRMALAGSFFSSAVSSFIISRPGIDASLAGFALAFAISFRYTAVRSIRLVANLELDMNAAERVFEFAELETEPQSGSDNLRASWPEKGKLEVKDLEVGYAADLPSILKGLTFTAESNQRIGVVGRTGAGKSTLSLALFRFLEARKGSIVIDGVDISTIKLHDLRTRLAIIPQDPVLFSGTIRSNLDPFDEHSDAQLREVLERVHLVASSTSTPLPEMDTSNGNGNTVAASSATTSSTAVTLTPDPRGNANIFRSLSSPISSGGANLSQGQKQLLCLARSILSRPRVLLLDEATSAVDMVTDTLIQRSIREEFTNTTLLVVAHRLSTVVDFDRILVMKDGVAAEFGSPKDLLGIEGGVFKGLVEQSGEREVLEGRILGDKE